MKLNIKNQTCPEPGRRISKFLIFAFSILIFSPGCGMDHRPSAISSEKILVITLSEKTEYQPLLTGTPQTCGMRSGRVYLLPSQSVGEHSTKAHEELLVFLSGKGTALIGKEQTAFEIGKGKVCYIPPHTTHDMKNTGTEPLIYIYCVAPVK
jgi:mannose-6-phosphate isomerase-like protein (cupin superfamily)